MTSNPRLREAVERVTEFAELLESGYTVYAGGAKNRRLEPEDLRTILAAIQSSTEG